MITYKILFPSNIYLFNVKLKVRALGIDDSPFSRENNKSYLIGSVVREKNYLEGLIIEKITVDGIDSTDVILKMISGKFSEQIKIIFMNGITFAGFNVANIEKIYLETKIPIITVVRKMPSMEEIEQALKKHFTDWEERLNLMKKFEIKNINGVYVQKMGIEWKEVGEILLRFTVRGKIPEPIRISHIIGSALIFGYSKKKP